MGGGEAELFEDKGELWGFELGIYAVLAMGSFALAYFFASTQSIEWNGGGGGPPGWGEGREETVRLLSIGVQCAILPMLVPATILFLGKPKGRDNAVSPDVHEKQ